MPPQTMGTWTELLGKHADDPLVQAALAAAGIKKIPKRTAGASVIFELEGHHLWLEMTVERRKAPLILTSVEAVLSHPRKQGGYEGSLPLGLVAGMNRDGIRQLLGQPSTIVDDVPADIWLRDGLELNVTYASDLKLQTFALSLP